MLFDDIPFTTVEGRDTGRDLKVFALTTCGFCKRAMAFMHEQGPAFSYVYVDELGPDIKQELKDRFYKAFGAKMLFPTLLVDGKDFLPGFIRLHWEKALTEI
ncbi:MAG: glutaredoxin [Spirochaetales bacterium]|nr:glutaredoxin [Spirochaetales bacterium]